VPPLDKTRFIAQDEVIIGRFFESYSSTIKYCNMEPKDTYNIDKNGVIVGQIGEEGVIITTDTRVDKKLFITQDGSRE
jgi:20S proteasome alpha/beta subunit